MVVLCPHSPGALREETMDGVRVVRYRYAPTAWETLVNEGGILGNLKKSWWKWLLVPGFLTCQLISTARLIRGFKPHVVQAHWLVPQGVIARLAMLVARRRPGFVATSHGADLFSLKAWPFRLLKRWVLRRADIMTVVSQAMVAQVHALQPDCHVQVEPMGVDLVSTFHPEPAILRSRTKALFVGRLVEKKGVEHLLKAWPIVLQRRPDARLEIVGFGALEGALRRLQVKLGLEESVSFLGPISQSRLPDFYRSAATLVAPFVAAGDGDQEGLGLVMVEALGCGCPVVAGDVPAVRDVLGDGLAGLLVDPRDSNRLADAIVAAMARGPVDPSVVSKFDWGARAEAYARLIDDASEKSRRPRKGHAALDLAARRRKGMKIARLLGVRPGGVPGRVLEVGAGSGGISHYFGKAGAMGWDADAVDVNDTRVSREGYRFTRVEGVALPFPDASFDLVVSNHVIEHVGEEDMQVRHLEEIARVMRPDGRGYIAVPSRWMLVEPHFKLPLLSWLPRTLADFYVRRAGKGSYYDCRPLTVAWIERAMTEVGLDFRQCHGEALKLTYEIERPESLLYRWILRPCPGFVFGFLRRAFPTLIYVVSRKADRNRGLS